jgi:hypothetical protein
MQTVLTRCFLTPQRKSIINSNLCSKNTLRSPTTKWAIHRIITWGKTKLKSQNPSTTSSESSPQACPQSNLPQIETAQAMAKISKGHFSWAKAFLRNGQKLIKIMEYGQMWHIKQAATHWSIKL